MRPRLRLRHAHQLRLGFRCTLGGRDETADALAHVATQRFCSGARHLRGFTQRGEVRRSRILQRILDTRYPIRSGGNGSDPQSRRPHRVHQW